MNTGTKPVETPQGTRGREQDRPRLSVLGAGGHGAVVIATAQAAGYDVVAVFDDDSSRHGSDVLGVPVEGPIRAFPGGSAVFGIGSNQARRRLSAELEASWQALVHPRAWVHSSVFVGAGAVVFAGAVVQPRTRIGAHAIINTGASVDHDCTIGEFVHIGPGAHLCGGVRVGDSSLVGVGVSVRPEISIGDGVTVGAGAAVVENLEAGVTALGVPCRPR